MEQIGGYQLESKLGEGGMGAVYRATNPRFPGRTFALKVLGATKEASARERFEREMKALSIATTHPNIVRIFGGTVEAERPFYVMELVQGKSLDSIAGEPLDPKRAAQILRGVADAMAHVHEQGVVHRDLKPANIVLEAGDKPRVVDFGLASLVGEDRLTKTGQFLGTPAYAAPEQLDGRSHEADARADVYALGAILHYLLAGRPPFDATSDGELMRAVLLQNATPPSRHLRNIPVELDAICLRALEKEPGDRYPTAVAFRDELDRFLRGDAVVARVPGRREKLFRALKRHRREARLVVSAIIIIGAAAVFFGVRHTVSIARRQKDETIRNEALATNDEGVIREKLQLLADADPDLRLAVQDHLGACQRAVGQGAEIRRGLGLDDALRAADPVTAKLVDVAVDAIVWSGTLLAPGEALLSRRDAILSEPPANRAVQGRAAVLLLETARRLAAQREDRDGRTLEAFALLAERGAEREPFGRGRLPDPSSAMLLRDLETAATGDDAVASRASGLLVDLALATGDAAQARAVFDRRRTALLPADRDSFDRIFATRLDGDELARALPADAAAAVRRTAELARLLALAGAPGAIEHPEVADPSIPLDLIARRDHPAPRHSIGKPPEEELGLLVAELSRQIRALHEDVFKPVPLETTQATFDAVRARHDELTRKSLEADPRGIFALERAGMALRQRLSTGPFVILAACETPDYALELATAFSNQDRAILRIGNTGEYFDEAVWEIPWQEFDARLAKDMATDPIAAVMPADRMREAAMAAGGLYRMDALALADEGTLNIEPAVRRQLALEALIRLDHFRALGPSAVLPFAAKLDKLALPAPLGERLAELELRRALAYGEDALQLAQTKGEDSRRWCLTFHLMLNVAMVAAEDPGARKRGLHFEIYDLAMRLIVPLIQPPIRVHPTLDYMAIRTLGRRLRDSLENDPKRKDWKKDFEPR